MLRSRIVGAAGAALALWTAACGGDGGDGASAASDSGSDATGLDDGGFPDAAGGTGASGAAGGSAGAGGSGAGGTSGSGATSGSGGAPPDAGDPNFTADGCFKWAGVAVSQLSLHEAIAKHACVEVQAGTFTIASPLIMSPGHTLRGISPTASVIVADQSAWQFNCCDSMVADSMPADPTKEPFRVASLTLDGAGVATYNVCCRGYTAESAVLKRSRCSAIGIADKGVVAKGNQMLDSAQPTQVPGKGTITCASGGFGGVAEGAAIYSESKAGTLSPLIENNTISGTNGPALDVNGTWGGIFRGNTVSNNSAWAAVSLYGASNWLVENNQISHPSGEPPQPYHPYCASGPNGGHAAAIFLCQDTDANNLVTNGNQIVGNKASSYYGILSVGADELKPYFAPRNNTFQNNDVFGSVSGCGDDFAPGQWMTDKNTWSGNNCAGSPNTGPSYF